MLFPLFAPFLKEIFRPYLLASMADTYLLEAICHLNYWNTHVQSGPVRSSCSPLQVGHVGLNLSTNVTLPNGTTLVRREELGGHGFVPDFLPPLLHQLSWQPRVIPLARPGQCLQMRQTGSLFPDRTNPTAAQIRHRYSIRGMGQLLKPSLVI